MPEVNRALLQEKDMNYFSMFSGIGGFELGIQRAFDNRPNLRNGLEDIPEDSTDITQPQVRSECIGYSEIDKYAIKVYERQFGKYESCDEHAHISEKPEQEERTQRGERPTNKHGVQLHDRNRTATLCNRCKGHTNYGDATTINPTELPDFDLLVGGFPCQAFSIAGKRRGFDDTRGTLFFDIARILAEKRPRHLVLENVKGLLSHDSGKTFQTILGVLSDLGYLVEWQVLNSKDFGVPQNRERVYIVGHLGNECGRKVFPITGQSPTTLRQDTKAIALHNTRRIATTSDTVNTLSSTFRGNPDGDGRPAIIQPVLTPDRVEKRQNGRRFKDDGEPSFTVTAQDKHGVYDGLRIRRLTPVECMRLQGFPDDWCSTMSDTQAYKQAGNAVTVNAVEAVITQLLSNCSID